MRLIFSRKGFDSTAGGVPSPFVEGRPVSLPIPTRHRSETTYRDLGLGELVERRTRGRIGRDHLCHADPFFYDGRCYFGQTGSAQAHLANQRVGIGDLFLFFGLFQTATRRREHWIFGYLHVDCLTPIGMRPAAASAPRALPFTHPHFLGEWNANNTLYEGEGQAATRVDERLRLTAPGSLPSCWSVPPWLRDCGLSYHVSPGRWSSDGMLTTVARGQEFVADISSSTEAQPWISSVIEVLQK